MNIIPVGYKILVKREKLEQRDPAYRRASQAGIVLPDHEDKRRAENGVDRGHVLALGQDAFKAYHLNSYGTLENFTPWVKEGDYITFAKYAGKVVEDPENPENEYLVINDEDVVAIIKEAK